MRSIPAVRGAIVDIVKRFEGKGQLDNTYFVFTSDNGYRHGEHAMVHGKHTTYEEDINVPLFVRGPDVSRGVGLPNFAPSIDLAPTFCEWASVNPCRVQGSGCPYRFSRASPSPGAPISSSSIGRRAVCPPTGAYAATKAGSMSNTPAGIPPAQGTVQHRGGLLPDQQPDGRRGHPYLPQGAPCGTEGLLGGRVQVGRRGKQDVS